MNELRLLITGAAVLGVLSVSACDGENLFSVRDGVVGTGGQDVEAPVVDITSPRGDSLSAKPIGDSVFVSAHVTDDVGIRSVRFFGTARRGDPNLGTEEIVDRFFEKIVSISPSLSDSSFTKDTTITRYLIPTADDTRETVQIIVEARDTAGNIAADTADLILGGPDVEILDLVNGQTVQAGLNMAARVRAQDPLGIIQVRLEISGAFQSTLVLPVNPPADSVVLDSVVAIPSGVSGDVQVVGVARNNLDVAGQDGPITLTVISGEAGDTTAPSLVHRSTAPERLELQDTVVVSITGSDDNQGGGIARAGYTVLGISASRGDTVIRSQERTFSPSRTGSVTTSFAFPPFNVDSLGLPDTLVFEISSFMIDAAGNCAASVGAAGAPVSLPCATLPTGQTVAQNRAGERLTRSVVAGKTVVLPTGGVVMDAVVDTTRRNLYLSNIGENQIEVFRLQEEFFLEPIGVGAAPWGLSLNQCPPLAPTAGCGDTLHVGNSGGTNLSNVFLGPTTGEGPASEDAGRRLLTPDVALFDIRLLENDVGAISYDVAFHPQPSGGFSDRPQFLARDSTGRMLYSTKVVPDLEQVGTIRKVEVRAGYVQPEVKIFVEHAEFGENPDAWAVAHVDEVAGGTEVTLIDHVPGDPTNTITATSDPNDAASTIQGGGSDIYIVQGALWNVANVGFSDTTFVTASGDGGWVAFGEGSVTPVGRIIMYEAATDLISGVVEVTDLMTNAGEEVKGLSLNYDGTLGVVRGVGEVAFFTTDLRLQGSPDLNVSGGAGAVMHPLHANARSLANPAGEYRPDTHLAFVGTGERTIDIYDTFRFRRTGRLFIRDIVSGPLRASLPFAEDNLDQAGNPLQCVTQPVTDQVGRTIGEAVEIFQGGDFLNPWPEDGGGGSEDRCVVLKLYGATNTGGVVVIDVRKGDVLRNHPSR